MLALAAILVGSYFGWQHFANTKGADSALSAKTTTGASAPVPVTVATAQRADFPVYLNGLGTVQPFNTVTVRSRVDGQITKVEFQQGRMVKQGDVLVQIDPRPYQAALTQALSKKAQDEANLKNAKLNLDRYQSLADKDFASKQQVDTQQAMVDQLTALRKAFRDFRSKRPNFVAQSQFGVFQFPFFAAPAHSETHLFYTETGSTMAQRQQSGCVFRAGSRDLVNA
jgi:multidrug efflux pump subunit AcrA (membrane-fusion protein)